MPARWYYQNQAGVVGPVSIAELKYLIQAGTIRVTTLVRRGDDGPWFAVDNQEGLLETTGDADEALDSGSGIPQWHFSLKGGDKRGPVPRSALKDMIAAGKLQPSDLVWKPGMAMWVAASQVPGLMDQSPPTTDRAARFHDRFALLDRPHTLRAGIAGMVVLVLIVAVFAWRRTRVESGDQPNAGGIGSGTATGRGARLRGGIGQVEQLLGDARTAVRLEEFDRATRVLDQYLASPSAAEADVAKLLLREIKLATSTSDAAQIARGLGDEPLRDHLRRGVGPLVASIRTPELQSIYERTLLQAFRQENNRRQMVPRVALAQHPNAVEADRIANGEHAGREPEPQRAAAEAPKKPQDPPRLSIFGPAAPAGRGQGGNPEPKNDDARLAHQHGPVPADLDDVLAKPEEFVGNTLVLNGLFKIATKVSEVKGPDGQVLGSSLPVAHNDGTTVCSVEGKAGRQDVFLLLEDRLVAYLDRLFDKLGVEATIKPSYKCILTATTRRLLVNGSPTPVVIISSMEVLGECDYLSVARHEYAQAFLTLNLTPDGPGADFGAGDRWVERLGGEEKFAQPIRRKLHQMERRGFFNRDRDSADRIVQRELAKAVDIANAINPIVTIERLRRMRSEP